jgi:hypothetical protein
MGQPGSISTSALGDEAHELGLAGEPDVIVLAGRACVAAAVAVWPNAATPLAGVGGVGRQLAVLADNALSGWAASC